MKLFRLRKELKTGMVLIDEQHHQYGLFVNKFLKISNHRESVCQETLLKASSFLHAYARDHLRTEEALMATYDYPRREQHMAQHRRFSGWVEEIHTKVVVRPLTPDELVQVNYSLVDWFQNHIKTEDRALTDHLHQVAHERGDHYLLGLIRGIFGQSLATVPGATPQPPRRGQPDDDSGRQPG